MIEGLFLFGSGPVSIKILRSKGFRNKSRYVQYSSIGSTSCAVPGPGIKRGLLMPQRICPLGVQQTHRFDVLLLVHKRLRRDVTVSELQRFAIDVWDPNVAAALLTLDTGCEGDSHGAVAVACDVPHDDLVRLSTSDL